MRSACRHSGGHPVTRGRPPRQIFRWHRVAPDWPLEWQCGHPKSHPAANSALEGLHGRRIAGAGHVGRSFFQRRSDGFANVVMPALGPHHHWRRREEDLSRHDGRSVGGVQAVLPDAAGVTRPTLRSRALRALRPRPRRLRRLTQHPCRGPHPHSRQRSGLRPLLQRTSRQCMDDARASALSSSGRTSCTGLKDTAADLVATLRRPRSQSCPSTVLAKPARDTHRYSSSSSKNGAPPQSSRAGRTDWRPQARRSVVALCWSYRAWSAATVKSLA